MNREKLEFQEIKDKTCIQTGMVLNILEASQESSSSYSTCLIVFLFLYSISKNGAQNIWLDETQLIKNHFGWEYHLY